MGWLVGRKIKREKKTGTTTDDWETVFNEYCGDFSTKIVYVRNTGANSLDYEIIGDLDDLGEDDVSVTSGSLASGDVLVAEITRNYYKLKLRVRSTTAGASTDYVAKINFQV